MERKLASIQKISKIEPIDGADKIEVATVNGWNVVVAKDMEYEPGEVVVYCEIDSFLPIKPEFEFLRKTSYKKMGDQEGFRLKTVRMRGVVSQGLILPISVIDDFSPDDYDIGEDVSEKLGIVKYETPIPACLAGVAKGSFPSFLVRTDEERCLAGNTVISTPNGNMTIKEIVESRYSGPIISYNHLTSKLEQDVITDHSCMRDNKEWYKIETATGHVLEATGNHMIWCDNINCYRQIKDLDGSEIIYIKD